jgi:hypothetical protein
MGREAISRHPRARTLGIGVLILGIGVAASGVPLGIAGTILIGVIALLLLEPGRGRRSQVRDARLLARQARWEADWAPTLEPTPAPPSG